jgi:hypothetical protein
MPERSKDQICNCHLAQKAALILKNDLELMRAFCSGDNCCVVFQKGKYYTESGDCKGLDWLGMPGCGSVLAAIDKLEKLIKRDTKKINSEPAIEKNVARYHQEIEKLRRKASDLGVLDLESEEG